MTISLSEAEAELLRSILNRSLGETRSEIYHTDTASFRDLLKSQEAAVRELLHKLEGSSPRPA